MKFKNLFILLLSTFMVFNSTIVIAAELVVIVHPSNSTSTMTKSELKKIFLMKRDSFPNGLKAQPFNNTRGAPQRSLFYSKIVGRTDSQMKAYWAKLVFSGKGSPPKTLEGSDKIKEAVANNKNGIGYIESDLVDSSVKVVFSL